MSKWLLKLHDTCWCPGGCILDVESWRSSCLQSSYVATTERRTSARACLAQSHRLSAISQQRTCWSQVLPL